MADHAVQLPEQGSLSLADEINKSTRDVHHELNMLVMSRLPLGLKNRRAFREGFLCFSHVYRAFEPTFAKFVDPLAAPSRTKSLLSNIWFPELLRAQPLEEDLKFYYDLDSVPLVMQSPSKPMQAYVASRMKSVLESKPHLLLAYAHIFYMALFSGGQHMKAAMLRSEALMSGKKTGKDDMTDAGVRFFSFQGYETKDELSILRERFRSGHREAEKILSSEERDDILVEAREIFLQTLRLVEELDAICSGFHENPKSASSPSKLGLTPTAPDFAIRRTLLSSTKDSILSGLFVLGAFVGYVVYVVLLRPSYANSVAIGLA